MDDLPFGFIAPLPGGKRIGTAYGAPQRTPYPSEMNYFKSNPNVSGMAAEDNAVILNPYSRLSTQEYDAVKRNEASRIFMRKNGYPKFDLTKEQEQFLANTPYGTASEEDRRATIAARILSGDPTAGRPTKEQAAYVEMLRRMMEGR